MKRLEEWLEVDSVTANLLRVGDIIVYNTRARKVITTKLKGHYIEVILADVVGDRRQVLFESDHKVELLWYGDS